ncbi:hypothetical protein [Endozoicomonas elysicola]|uniref:Uncharacterized protein n=1 Tax=Endozoicomonas elysicola TaxID=305900 RepID=A0A081KBI9_9GAMM|nr:hypothetical protein [Endozoicomonas elysicola]KEI71515.1 hypothetical protein GV64_12885 [Endozoicomonas elysicola]
MKSKFATIALSTLLSISIVTSASAGIPAGPKKRFENEVVKMTQIMGLNSTQADQILDLKIDLYKKNQQARKQFGEGSSELSSAMNKNMQAYQKGVSKSVSKKQLQALFDSRNK